MRPDRRRFLTTGAAAALAPRAGWAAVGAPSYLTAAIRPDGAALLVGLSAAADVVFTLPLPTRGHAAAAHPARPEAVAFARRPGTHAVVIDCAGGREIARLTAPAGRHFYGHGAFTADGRLLLTTENDYDAPAGRIGIWDARAYRRIGEVASGGIGPHEIIRLSAGGFAVANGGIQTHPDFARARLNLPTMRPNLAYLSATAALEEVAEPPEALRRNSIRHIAAHPDGRVLIALQWQGDPSRAVPLAASHRRGGPLIWHDHEATPRLKGYAGSIAVSADGGRVAITGPKGDSALFFDAGMAAAGRAALDVGAGAAAAGDGFLITCEGGLAFAGPEGARLLPRRTGWSWDNHLVAI